MARFQLTRAVAPGQLHFSAGEIVTDQQPGVLGDRYWPNLSAGTIAAGMVPLDPSGVAMKNASVFKNEIVSATITGADSIGVQR
jgi:hypothetical protein